MALSREDAATMNSRGQALVESALVLPVLIPFVTLLMASLYLLLAIEWTDFWTYKAAICLAENQTERFCKQELEQKLRYLISKNNFLVVNIWKTKKQTQVRVQIHFQILPQRIFQFKKMISSQLKLPLLNNYSH